MRCLSQQNSRSSVSLHLEAIRFMVDFQRRKMMISISRSTESKGAHTSEWVIFLSSSGRAQPHHAVSGKTRPHSAVHRTPVVCTYRVSTAHWLFFTASVSAPSSNSAAGWMHAKWSVAVSNSRFLLEFNTEVVMRMMWQMANAQYVI